MSSQENCLIEGDEMLEVQTQREDLTKTHWVGSPVETKERSLWEENSCENTLIMNVYLQDSKKINVCCLIQMASGFVIVRVHNNKAIIIASFF